MRVRFDVLLAFFVCLPPVGTGTYALGGSDEGVTVSEQDPPPIAREKAARTPAQRKIDSQLLYALYARRGDAARLGTPTGPFPFDIDARGRVRIDVRAEVTDTLVARVRALGGDVLSTSAPTRSIDAWFPLDHLERLAALEAVRFIEPAARSITHRPPQPLP